MTIKTNFFHFKQVCFTLLFGSLLLSSCSTARFLDKSKGEIFLSKNEIIIEKPTEGKIRNKSNLVYELSKLYKQRPNRKFFGVPRQFFYYTSLDTINKTRLGKSFSKVQGNTLGEEPVFLDTVASRQTAIAMQNYLQNRGYFFAKVEEEITTNKKETKAFVTYHAAPGGVFKIDSAIFISKDTAIQRKLNSIATASFLQKGQPIDIKLYEQEVARITRFLRNNGYAYFYPQFIANLEGKDSSNTKLTSKIELEILVPPGKTAHQAYKVGDVHVYPNFDPLAPLLTPADTVIDGIYFAKGNAAFKVKPRTLSSNIFFRTGDYFNQEELDNTVRQLGALGVFRPPTIRFEEDSLQQGVLNFFILLTANKKWEFGADFDINTVERKGAVGNRNLIGLSFSPSLRNRNFLRGAELLVGTVDMGIELAPFGPDSSLVNTVDFRLQGDLYFPRFADYFKIWRGLQKAKIISESFYGNLRRKATSRYSSSYNLLLLLNNYSLQFTNLSYGFDFPLPNNDRIIFNHFGVDLVVPKIVKGSSFEELLNNQPFLENSFSKQFITGIFFRDLTYVHTSRKSEAGASWLLRGYFDLSGLEVMTLNTLYNAISQKSPDFEFFNIDFSHYFKLETDTRRYWELSPNRSFVARLNAGITVPYYHSATVPYIKQFYVGGAYSMRGWYARGLGPGLYQDSLTNDATKRNLFYQSGDVKLELNLEYRFFLLKPFGFFNLYGAFFLDAGNIWTLKKDANRPGSHLAWDRRYSDGRIVQDNFLKEMAVSVGFGSRWDFTYFVFRLDLGTPIRNNFPDAGRNNSYFIDFSKWQLKDFVFNIGLGYPF